MTEILINAILIEVFFGLIFVNALLIARVLKDIF